jgi:Lar family restriction alleviation protein
MELLPCPFCGSEVHIEKMDEPWVYFGCSCNMHFSYYDVNSEAEAAEAWNRRA